MKGVTMTNQSSIMNFTSIRAEVGGDDEKLMSVVGSNKDEMEEMPIYGYAICIVTMIIIWVVGSAGNFLVVYIVCKEKQLQTPMNMFLVNLSVADFITSAFGSPFPLAAAILHRWPFGELICVIYAFGMALGGITSITTLMVLAFERYLMISRPFRAADIRLEHSAVIVIAIWFYSLALTLPPLFGWADYGPEGPYVSCSVSWEKDDLTTKSYICFLFILGLVLPLFTIIFSYVGIVLTVKSTTQSQSCGRSATARAELRVTGMVAVMIICFLVAWSPYAIVSLIVAFGGEKGRGLITPLVSVLPAIFAKSATCYNPVIYVGLNTQFQVAWLKLFGIRRESDETQTGLTASIGGGGTTTAVPVSLNLNKALAPLPSSRSHSPSLPITKSKIVLDGSPAARAESGKNCDINDEEKRRNLSPIGIANEDANREIELVELSQFPSTPFETHR